MSKRKLDNRRAALNAALRRDFRTFVRRVFETVYPADEFIDNWHIDAMIYHLLRGIRGETNRLIITIPPKYLKSLCASVALPAFLLGLYPDIKIACVSYTDDLARKFARERRMIFESEWYRRIFPHVQFTKDTEAEVVTRHGGTIRATSIEGGLTGHGFNWIIVDDPIKTGAAMSAAERTHVNNWIKDTAYTRLIKKNRDKLMIVMQRVHVEDLVGYVLERDDWSVLRLKAIATEDERIPISDESDYVRLVDEALHPEWENLATLERHKRFIGSFNFAAQYQQDPVPGEGCDFQREWFKIYRAPLQRERFAEVYQSWDTAAGIGESASYSVCCTFGIHEEKVYLLDVFRGRMLYPELRYMANKLAERWRPNLVLIEKASTGFSLLEDLSRLTRLPLKPIEPKLDKVTRAQQASAAVEGGLLHIPAEASWLAELLNEVLAFPHSKHDDQVDSLSQFLNWWQNHPRRPRPLNVRITLLGRHSRIRDRYAERTGRTGLPPGW